jgi:AcrR family transcriptional regulator
MTRSAAPDPPRRTGERRARIGGRSERVVRDVLQAAAAELGKVGYAALRVENVAAAAGVNKTTVYRRWPAKADLVAAAIREMRGPAQAPPDTGSLRGDLLHLIREYAARAASPEKKILARMLTVEQDHPEVKQLVRALREEHQAPWLAVIRRAAARGELRPGSDPRLIQEAITAPVFSRLFRHDEPVDDAYLGALVDLVARGAESSR